MKTKLILYLAFLTGIYANAQDKTPSQTITDNSPTSYVALNIIGTSIPFGDYGSTTSTNAGYATTGIDFNATDGTCIAHSNFGLSFKIDYFINGFDLKSFLNTEATDPNLTYVAQSKGNYSAFSSLIGGYITIPVHKFAFDFRVMGGIMSANFPAIAVGVSDANGNAAAIGLDAGSGSAFAFDIGMNIRWNVSNHICILLAYDYLQSNPTFNTTEEIIQQDQNGNISQGSQPTTFSQKYTVFTSTIGIGWIFGRK